MKNYSKQREVILNFLQNTRSHPTAEEILMVVKENCPTISRGTVYRNLVNLCEEGLVRKVRTINGVDRYEYVIHEHSHIVCLKCGKVADLEYKLDLNEINDIVCNSNHYTIQAASIIINGICPECKEKMEENNG